MRQHQERWSLLPYRNDDPPDRKLALEIVERVLPARLRIGMSVNGRPVPYDELPLTMSFIVRAAEVLGVRLGQKHAYRVQAEALQIFHSSGFWPRKHRHGLVLYLLRQDRFRACCSEPTPVMFLSAEEPCQVPAHPVFEERGPP